MTIFKFNKRENMKKQTLLSRVGHTKTYNEGYVNPPIYKGSTVTFDTVKAFEESEKNEWSSDFYGLISNPTQRAFEEAISTLEGADYTIALPSGLAAITVGLLAFVKAGDHILITNAAYGPTSRLADKFLKNMNIEVDWYPSDCLDILPYIKENTKIIYAESPASLTMDIADIPAICKEAQKYGIKIIYDNTWSAGYFCKAFELGVDVTLHAGTKFVGGHSDILIGMISTKSKSLWKKLKHMAVMFGYGVSAEDCWLALRSLRSLKPRLIQHQKTGVKVANWLKGRLEVKEILHPALPACKGYDLWKRDFTGAPGLFSFVLNSKDNQKVEMFLNELKLFRMGVSWGGHDSLIIRFDTNITRKIAEHDFTYPHLRIHCGLEDSDDLIEDLKQAFEKAHF